MSIIMRYVELNYENLKPPSGGFSFSELFDINPNDFSIIGN